MLTIERKIFCVNLIVNLLTPKSEEHLVSPHNITLESHANVMRIGEMITYQGSSWLLNKFLLSALKEIYWENYREYSSWCYAQFFKVAGYSLAKLWQAIFSKLVNQLSPFAFKGFHTWVDKRMEVHNSGCSMVIVINMLMLWKNPIKQFLRMLLKILIIDIFLTSRFSFLQ